MGDKETRWNYVLFFLILKKKKAKNSIYSDTKRTDYEDQDMSRSPFIALILFDEDVESVLKGDHRGEST